MQFKKEKAEKDNMNNIERFCKPQDEGLTEIEVMQRRSEGLVNKPSDASSHTTGKIILSNIFTYFNVIFFALAAALIYEGSYYHITFLGVVLANTVISIVQELRSKRELEKLTVVCAPVTKAVREGKVIEVSSEELVLDDIVIFEAGNQICADATVCEGELNVNESLVTGESDEIKKSVGDTLLSGSFVVSGSCRASLEKVGDEAFASKLSKDAKKIKKRQKPGMMKSLTVLIRSIGIIIIPFSVVMYYNQHFVLGLAEKLSVENTVAAIIGMIPEGLYLLTSIALAASVIRLAKSRTLVHDMKCIETLARVDVICVDKTGTITEPEMTLEEIINIGGDADDAREKLHDFAICMSRDNITMQALKAYFGDKSEHRDALAVKKFSPTDKYSAVKFANGSYVFGAPDMILKDISESIDSLIREHSENGERVLLFAAYECEEGKDSDIFSGGTLTGKLVPLSLITFSNRIRESAKATFEYFTEQNVAIKVISGDNPMTVSKIAGSAGIPGSEKYVDVSSLSNEELSDPDILEYTVFGRVSPAQKRLLVKTLKKAGHTVGMTGDGVNDVLALKDADCSVAMASGSEAAANVADLVLLDSDFSAMPSVVLEGRRVINNIQRSASLFLVKNIFSFALSLFAIFSVSAYPLKPSQLSLVSTFMVGIPSFFLALAPNKEMVKGKFLRNVLYNALPSALTAIFLIIYALLMGDAFNIDVAMLSTMSCLIYAMTSYVMLYKVCKPFNVLRAVLFLSMGALFVAVSLIIPEWFSFVPLSYGAILITLLLIMIVFPVSLAMQKVVKKVRDFPSIISGQWAKFKEKLHK